mgnify:CR=1 FL=1
MARKKTTEDNQPKSTSKTRGTPKRSRKAQDREEARPTETTGESLAAPAAESVAKKPRTRRRASVAETTTAPSGEEAATVARRVFQPLSPEAQVEESEGTIVIRFPPVAPIPFVPPAAPAEPPAEQSICAAAPPPTPTAETRAEVAPLPTVEPEALPAPSTGPEEPRLTRSQRRRLRRRRGRERRAQAAAQAAATTSGTGADISPPAPAAPETPSTAGGETEPQTSEVGSFEEQEEQVASWLDDVEVVKQEAEGNNGRSAALLEPPEAKAEPEAAIEQAGRRRRRGRRGRREVEVLAEQPATATLAAPEEIAAEEAEGAGPKVRREMIINTVQREECRIAILENGRLEEIYLERAAAENHVGNIYKGIVTNVEPSIQAAFVDFGQGKNGFLHISDLHPQYFPEGGGAAENVGRKMPRRSRPPIQRCLRRGQQVLVQVTKEGIGTKGPTLSTYLSIPGRYLVMMPGMRRLGVSRRIEDEGAREKLRALLAELELPEGMGFIARTAAVDRSKRELQNDLAYLMRLWRAVEKRIKNDPAPAELYRESDLVIRTIRDVFTHDIERIVVDDPEVAERAREFLAIFSPRSQDIVQVYSGPEPIFHKYQIEPELERLHSRHVPLKSGGSLVIDQTEALVAIDVNSGRFRTEEDAETTAYKINCEAADEIPRQLRLRDLGGVIVCDFIDMRQEAHRRDIERRLIENLKKHKERAKVLRTSAFGLIEMTRQRQRASLTRSIYRDCRHCRGTGLVKTPESVVLDVMRLIQLAVTREHIRMVEVTVAPDVAYLLQNRKRALIHELETKHRRIVSIRPDPNFGQDQVEITCTDARGRVVPHM